jgi:cytochrome b561
VVVQGDLRVTYGNLPPTAYPPLSKLLHWLVGISVIVQIPLGTLLVYADLGARQDAFYNFHKSLGVAIFILMALRLLNRVAIGAPAPDPTIVGWQRVVSSAVHGSLYGLLLIQPIVGYWANSAFGATTPFFGAFEIPAIGGEDQVLAGRLFAVHRWLGILIALLAMVHVGAALQHYFIRRDSVLQRMLPQALGGRAAR